MLLKKFSILFLAAFSVVKTFSQNQYHWTGAYFGPSMGAASSTLTRNSYNAIFYQVSGVFIPSRGIVIVPGTSRDFGALENKKIVFTGGLQVGYIKQFNQWAAGIEADILYSSNKISEDRQDSLPATAITWVANYAIHQSIATTLNESIRAKFGYTMKKSFTYLTIGPSFTNIKTKTDNSYSANRYWPQPSPDGMAHATPAADRLLPTYLHQNANKLSIGLTLGVGYEWAFSKNCRLAIEYRHLSSNFTYHTNISDSGMVAADSRPTYYGFLAPTDQKIKLKSDQVTFRLNINLDPLLNSSSKNKNKKRKN